MYVLFHIVSGLLGLMPDVQWDVYSVSLTNFYSAIRMVFYIVPLDVVVPILLASFGLTAFRIFVSFIKTQAFKPALTKQQEKELLEKINELEIGPGGLGGKMTALGVNVEVYPTHIAGLPVAINMCCHVNRHVHRII